MMLRFATFAIGFAYATHALAGGQPCLSYEPAKVELTGQLERRTYPGPPGYESVERGDAPETGLYLVLRTSVCMKGDPNVDGLAYDQQDVRLVQLNLTGDGYKALAPFVGTTIRVSGTLYAAHTGHHHAPVVLLYQGFHAAAR